MYNIVIVDDESYIRKMFYELLNWEELNFKIVADFSNASDALDFIKVNSVDVVVTDIAMPGMSGIDLVKVLRQQKTDIPVVFLSGHADFTYAREAINHGVFGYILKPITYSELYEVFAKLSEAIQAKTRIMIDERKLRYHSTLLASFLIAPEENKENFCAMLTKLSPNINTKNTTIAVSFIIPKNFEHYTENVWHHDKQRIDLAMSNIITDKTIDTHIIPFPFLFNVIMVLIITSKPRTALENFAKEKLCNIKENLLTLLKLPTDILPISIFSSSAEITAEALMKAFSKTSNNTEYDFDTFFVSEVKKLINNHLGDNITQEEIARELKMNIAGFRKLFKDVTGEKFIDFSIRIKMDAAKEFLVKTDYIISDICSRIGYKSEDHFYATFKKYTGMTPNEYRRTNRSEKR